MPRKELTTAVYGPGKDDAIRVEVTLPPRQRRREAGDLSAVSKRAARSQIPRITRLMALAMKFQDMVDRGEVQDYSDLARLGYVSRARLTHIMNLRHLAPDIQQMLLGDSDDRHAPLTTTERDLRKVSRIVFWADQRQVWRQISGLDANGSVKTQNGRKVSKKVPFVAD